MKDNQMMYNQKIQFSHFIDLLKRLGKIYTEEYPNNNVIHCYIYVKYSSDLKRSIELDYLPNNIKSILLDDFVDSLKMCVYPLDDVYSISILEDKDYSVTIENSLNLLKFDINVTHNDIFNFEKTGELSFDEDTILTEFMLLLSDVNNQYITKEEFITMNETLKNNTFLKEESEVLIVEGS